ELTKSKDMLLYAVIPVYLTKEDSFLIYDYPSYTFVDNKEPVETNESELNVYEGFSELKEDDVKENIVSFLDTFFVAFSEDDGDKLSYLIEDKYYKHELNKTLKYLKLNDVLIYDSGNGNELLVKADVSFSQLNELLELQTTYDLIITQKEGRYIVTHVNDEQYIEKLSKGQTNDTKDEVESNSSNDNSELDKSSSNEEVNKNDSEGTEYNN